MKRWWRLCRAACGKAEPFRHRVLFDSPGLSLSEALDGLRSGKAQLYRTAGGEPHHACAAQYFTDTSDNPHAGAVAAASERSPSLINRSNNSLSISPRPTAIKVPAIERTM